MSQQTAQQRGFGVELDTLDGLHWTVIGLAAITGAVHLYLYVDQGFLPFLLAGLGFYGAIGLLLVTRGSYRHLLYLAGIPYTFAQIVAYYVVEQPQSIGDLSMLAMVDKLVQVALIVLLAYLFYSEWDGF